ncbi:MULTISPECIES: TetR/AcrR family transcriptional regulator [Actinosynnema]|uniref:TetR/AcrR family transcriptional regulator n=1 Tax=Actinosynnema TaxID=40566 RepID=UPI0020A4EBE1|nr:TetR family transcriptional regulator [Actinosynnema pretiosum]MCP2097869.1 transcriptional regulator, TetR family [Actinosynnema pretiosum]
MSYDSTATRARLLAAAHDEFAEKGFAGARVDRIASAATVNKQAIYAYFGSKEALFDAVLAQRYTVLADAVPMDARDLPAYAGALFDEITNDAGLQRLTLWKTLERPEVFPEEAQAHQGKAQAVVDAYGVSAETAMDALMLVLAAAQAWNLTPPAVRTPGEQDETARRARHRHAVVTAVAAITATLLE